MKLWTFAIDALFEPDDDLKTQNVSRNVLRLAKTCQNRKIHAITSKKKHAESLEPGKFGTNLQIFWFHFRL